MSITTDPTDPNLRVIEPSGMQKSYLVLSEEERAKGFTMPVYREYRHMKCGCDTQMSLDICETYARNPKFYGGTFCCFCGTHYPLLIAEQVQCPDCIEHPGRSRSYANSVEGRAGYADNSWFNQCPRCEGRARIDELIPQFYWVERDGNRLIPVGASPEEAEAIWAEKARQDAEKIKGAGI